ncbi:MAG: hypothetical protein ABR961_03410 [Thermoanaerobaculaceae bacterium]
MIVRGTSVAVGVGVTVGVGVGVEVGVLVAVGVGVVVTVGVTVGVGVYAANVAVSEIAEVPTVKIQVAIVLPLHLLPVQEVKVDPLPGVSVNTNSSPFEAL